MEVDVFLVISALAFIYCLYRSIKKYLSDEVECPVVLYTFKGHHWVSLSNVPVKYCSICESCIEDGRECDCCGVAVDTGCISSADSRLKCKLPSVTGAVCHHWVKGNCFRSKCFVCDKECFDEPGSLSLRCSWCQNIVHSVCEPAMGRLCDMGRYKRLIIPPNCVLLRSVGWKGRKKFVVEEILVNGNGIEQWNPLILIVNRKSGSREGDLALQAFRRVLNPAQVLDLDDEMVDIGPAWLQLLSKVQCRILICGGDGTIGWILSAIEKLDLKTKPEVCVLPLGTGNDLARTLGWGSGHSGAVDAEKLIQEMSDAVPVMVDRWQLSICPRQNQRRSAARLLGTLKHLSSSPSSVVPGEQSKGSPHGERTLKITNYFSVGVDALVCFNFHQTRHRLPRVLSSRFFNKLLFFHYGTKDLLEHSCKHLSKCVELFLDGDQVVLPELEGIVVLNIRYWGAGVEPWSESPLGNGFPKLPTAVCGSDINSESEQKEVTETSHVKLIQQSLSDGMLEVFGIYSSFHIAQMQVEVSQPLRIGQAKEVVIVTKHCSEMLAGSCATCSRNGELPVQADGEPWLQKPALIKISHCGQERMLATEKAYQSLLPREISDDDKHDVDFFLLE